MKVKIGNEPCPLCDIQVTAPDGKTFTGKTDENGEFSFPLSLEGPYKIILVDENGEVAAEAIIQSLPKPALQVETKPTAEDDGDPSTLFLIVLLGILLAGIVYFSQRNKK
ncbi:hypothetical protein KKE38_04270 [Candidatus Micrarchaeota archaeon]|nr:hypothetical protein [Candidatus Micrarchaeota archaeon]